MARIAEDVPTSHSSEFAPILHLTLEAGVEAITAATLSYLGRQPTSATLVR